MATPLRSLALCVALLGGCTNAVDPKKIEPALPGTAAEFCAGLRDALVARQGACFGELPEWARQEPTLPPCADIAKAVTLGHVSYDKAAAFDCVTAVQQLPCDDLLRLSLGVVPEWCGRALAGAVTSGSCAIDAECAAGTFCDANSNTCPRGACRPLVPLDGDCSAAVCQPGLACVNVSLTAVLLRCKAVSISAAGAAGCGGLTICTSGTFCDTAATPNVCRLQRQSGPCTAQEQCAPGYRCSLVAGAAGTCQRARALGAACTVGAQDCAVGSSCAGGACTLYPTAGGACGLIGGELVGCTASTCSGGTCAPIFTCSLP
jgi:hypothetical protein